MACFTQAVIAMQLLLDLLMLAVLYLNTGHSMSSSPIFASAVSRHGCIKVLHVPLAPKASVSQSGVLQRCGLAQNQAPEGQQCFAVQVGFWDGSVAVIRLQPSTAQATTHLPRSQASRQTSSCRDAQHDMVVLSHYQVDPTPLRAVAWCPPQVNQPPCLAAYLAHCKPAQHQPCDSRDTACASAQTLATDCLTCMLLGSAYGIYFLSCCLPSCCRLWWP